MTERWRVSATKTALAAGLGFAVIFPAIAFAQAQPALPATAAPQARANTNPGFLHIQPGAPPKLEDAERYRRARKDVASPLPASFGREPPLLPGVAADRPSPPP